MQQNTNLQNNLAHQQSVSNNTNDEELLKAFVGNNYEKITTNAFNVAGFFFPSFYMFYRKMFLYGILAFLINIAIVNVVKLSTSMVFNLIVGLFINQLYLSYAKNKINKIKFKNSNKSFNEIKEICVSKGGTSIGRIFLGFLAEVGITFIILIIMVIAGISGAFIEMFQLNNWNLTTNDNKINTNHSDSKKTLAEDVVIEGYFCMGSNCSVSIATSNNTSNYKLNVNNSELFTKLSDYSDYIKVNIYYTEKGNEKTIVDYQIYVKSTNENISDVSNEQELRNKLGFFSTGIHTESLKLVEIGNTGFGTENNTAYTYISYTFIDNNNIEYEMTYKNPNTTLSLIEGNYYTVTFEVVEGTLDYEFNIKSIQ